MNELQDGVTFRSEAYTWTAGSAIPIKTNFLEKARSMTAPECAWVGLRFDGTVNSSAGTDASGYDAYKLINRFRFNDDGGPIVDCSGQGLRLNEMIENGDRQIDPATLAAGAADAARSWEVMIPFWLQKAIRPRDTCLRLEHFLDGSDITLVCGALPTGWDGFTGTVTMFVRMFDGRRPEVKSRYTLREIAVTKSEDSYEINGSLRTAVMHTVLTTTSASSWAAYTTLDSQTLALPARFPTAMLRRQYREQSAIVLNTNDPIVASTPLAVPIVTPDRQQKIGRMPNIKSLHVDLAAAPPANAQLLMGVIRDRHARLASMVAGYANTGDYQVALEKRGEIVSAKGKNTPVTANLADLMRRLPVRVGGTVVP
jgi:hypothetical protein